MPTIRIETQGSVFEIDEDDLRYRRFPKQEAPRERPEWSDDRAGVLQDFVWHPYLSWEIRVVPALGEWERLVITTHLNEGGAPARVIAPIEPAEEARAWTN